MPLFFGLLDFKHGPNQTEYIATEHIRLVRKTFMYQFDSQMLRSIKKMRLANSKLNWTMHTLGIPKFKKKKILISNRIFLLFYSKSNL